MKKLLSTLLVASMLLSLVPAFAVTADETEEDILDNEQPAWTWDGDYKTINDAQEYVQFVGEINAGTLTDNGGEEGYKVAADLDLSDYDGNEVVMKQIVNDMKIDFQGHTVSGIVREVTVSDHVGVGLIADKAAGSAEVLNIKIKDCALIVTSTESWNDPQVSAVFGWSDRAFVSNVELENVSIVLKGNGKGFVGVAYGHHQWDNFRSGETSITMNNVLIDAPNALVGYAAGRLAGDAAAKIVVTGLSVANTTINAREAVTDASYVGTKDAAPVVSVKEGAALSVALVDDATGYCANGHTAKITAVEGPYVDAEGKTAGSSCLVCGEVSIPVEPIPAQTKYEAEDAVQKEGVSDIRDANETVSGGKFVGGFDNNGNSLTFTVKAKEAGKYTLTVGCITYDSRPLDITVNGVTIADVNCAGGGAWDANTTDTNIGNFDLVAGDNIIVLGQDAGVAPSVDYIELTTADPNKYQAEHAELYSPEANVEAGEQIRQEGNGIGWVGKGNTITFTVNAETAGKKTLTIVNIGPAGRTLEITVNDSETPIAVVVNDTEVEVEIELKEGENTIVLGNATDWAPGIDYITLADVVEDGEGEGSGEGEGEGSGEGEGEGSGEDEGEGSGEGEGEGSGEGEGEGSGEGEGEGSGEGEGEGSGEGEGEGSGEGEGEGSDSVAVGNGTVKIEAENAVSVNDDMELNADVLEDVSGSLVTSIGAAGKSDVQFTVDATVAGKYTLTIYYVTMGTRNIEISVNGGEAIVVSATGNNTAWNGGVLSVSTEITLDEGENTIVIGNRSDWSPNLDYIELAPASAEGGEGEGEGPAPTGDVTVYALAISAIALVGTAVVVSKKRHAAE